MMTILFLAALLVSADLEHFDNFAVNASFELDNDRDGSPDGWTAMAFDSPAQLEWNTNAARSGRRCLQISDSFQNGDQRDWKRCTGRWVSPPRPIVPGSDYTLEVWIKTENVTGQAYAHLAWQRGSRWISEDATPRLSETGDWQKVTLTAAAPEQADSLVVSMNLARSKGTAWFDDIRVSGRSEMPEEIAYTFNDTSDWYPFEFPLDDTNLDSIDLTHLVEKPAGKHGFVTVGDDGHFYYQNGKRARFYGTNVGGADCAPEKTTASVVAARLAKFGVNMLRLHSMDSQSGGLINYGSGDSQRLDPAVLDRIDFFVSELKKHGIYIYMDLLDYRMFRTADGVIEGDQFTHNWAGSMKGASIFDPRMIELQKDYATKLLTHRNPYTGLRYVDDPAIAMVETTNENSIFYFFRNADLSRPFYREALTARWNRWLLDHYRTRESLLAAWTDSAGNCALQAEENPRTATVRIPFGIHGRIPTTTGDRPYDPMLAASRISDLLRFLADVQRSYYNVMYRHLKEIGVRVPIAGTNQSFTVIDTFIEGDSNDFVSRNQYWRHPHRQAKPFFKFSNDPLLRVDIPTQRNPLSVIARTSVVGKPQAVAEFNFPWPNEYRAEGLLMSTAYACLQDWDVFLLFSYSLEDHRLSMFRSQSDPARWGTFPAAALMFHRADVSRGRNEVHVIHTPDDMISPRPDTGHARYTKQRFLTFLSKVRTGFVQDTYREKADAVLASGLSANAIVLPDTNVIRFDELPWETWLYPQFVKAAQELGLAGYERMNPNEKRFDADTGELSLDYGKGLLTIDTPRTQAAIGYLAAAGRQDLARVSIECQTDFAVIAVTALDELPLGESRRILITAVGQAENTSQGFVPPSEEQLRWNRTAWMLPGEGRTPVITEPIQADIRLGIPGAAKAYSLDPTGKRMAELAGEYADGEFNLQLGKAGSIWCEVIAPE